jgi:hypothetical protein
MEIKIKFNGKRYRVIKYGLTWWVINLGGAVMLLSTFLAEIAIIIALGG